MVIPDHNLACPGMHNMRDVSASHGKIENAPRRCWKHRRGPAQSEAAGKDYPHGRSERPTISEALEHRRAV